MADVVGFGSDEGVHVMMVVAVFVGGDEDWLSTNSMHGLRSSMMKTMMMLQIVVGESGLSIE